MFFVWFFFVLEYFVCVGVLVFRVPHHMSMKINKRDWGVGISKIGDGGGGGGELCHQRFRVNLVTKTINNRTQQLHRLTSLGHGQFHVRVGAPNAALSLSLSSASTMHFTWPTATKISWM